MKRQQTETKHTKFRSIPVQSSKEIESIFGKQSVSDNSFTAKSRLLQSMWRIENGIQMGVGPTKNSKTTYGYLNFVNLY